MTTGPKATETCPVSTKPVTVADMKAFLNDQCPASHERVTVEDMRKFAGIETKVQAKDSFMAQAGQFATEAQKSVMDFFKHPPFLAQSAPSAAPPTPAPPTSAPNA